MPYALSQKITHVRSEEYSDRRTCGAPDVLRGYVTFGKTVDESGRSFPLDVSSAGFNPSIDLE